MNMYYAGIGSRETPKEVLDDMTYIAQKLYGAGFILRSGGADGADTAFENGAGNKKEIYIPWNGFSNHKEDGQNYFLPNAAAKSIAASYHPKWEACSSGAKKLHSRNVHQVLGKDLQTPSKFVICWTKDGEASGGTGQAMRIAKSYHIPIFNLKTMGVTDVAKAIYFLMKEQKDDVA